MCFKNVLPIYHIRMYNTIHTYIYVYFQNIYIYFFLNNDMYLNNLLSSLYLNMHVSYDVSSKNLKQRAQQILIVITF